MIGSAAKQAEPANVKVAPDLARRVARFRSLQMPLPPGLTVKERKLAVGTVVAQVAALRFFFVRTLKRQQFREDPGTPRRGGLLNSRPRQQLLSRSPVRGREPHLWTACHFSVYAARKDQEQLQRASRRGIHDYLRSAAKRKIVFRRKLPARNTISAPNAGTHSHKSCEGEAE